MSEPHGVTTALPSTSSRLFAQGLSCQRGEHLLFRDFDLALHEGDLVWLRAPNGFGKTSLLRILAGLARSETGSIVWREDGHAVEHRRAPLYLAHANALKEDLTVSESLRFLSRLQGFDATDKDRIDAIKRFGMDGRRNAPIRTLSQGQRRRVALSLLCLSPPHAVWLLDEPYDALDQDGSAVVGALLVEHVSRRGCVLLTSHVEPVIANARVRTIRLPAPVDEGSPA